MPADSNINAALSITPVTENEVRLLSALREADASVRVLETRAYDLQTTNIRNERRIHHLDKEFQALVREHATREEMHARSRRWWTQEEARYQELESTLRDMLQQERHERELERERERKKKASCDCNDASRKRKRLAVEAEKTTKTQTSDDEKTAESSQAAKKEVHEEEDAKITVKEEQKVVVKKEPTDDASKNERKVTLSCNIMYEMARKREVWLRAEEERKKRNMEEAHDLWEKAVVAWEQEKEQTRREVQEARAYNKQAKEDHLLASARARMMREPVPTLVLRPIPTIPCKPSLWTFQAAAAAKKD